MRTIGDWIRLNAQRYPAREAIVAVDGRRTFGEAAERAWSLARGLSSIGVLKGTPVGVLAGNTLFNAETFLGCAAAGTPYAAYNWRWAPEELAAGILETRAPIIFVEERFEQLLEDALTILTDTTPSGYIRPRIIRPGEDDQLRTGTGYFDVETSLDDILTLIYTGGSTGVSKAVMVTHGNAAANAINEYADVKLGANPNERGLIVTPLFHIAGLVCWFVTHFVTGKTSVLADKFDEQDFVELVERERITNAFMIPNMMRRLQIAGVFESPAMRQHFRALHTGAGLLQMPDKEAFIESLPNAELFFRYGLTEGGPMVTRLQHSDMLDPAVDGSIGTEYLLVEAKVFTEDEQEAPPGELGEIVVRGPGVMRGYYGRPEVTAETLRGGWLHTGDLATRDERGYFYFKDRLKEMIKTGGENVYAAEVEQQLYLHPAVQEAVVLGVPDPKWDEEVRAVISFRGDTAASPDELKQFLRGSLAGYKVPKQFVFMPAEELPRSGAGKLQKSRLKEQLGWL